MLIYPHQPMLHSIHGDADHVSGFDFGHDVVAVGFDGFSLDKENIGYFLACFFLTNQLHDFDLLGGEFRGVK